MSWYGNLWQRFVDKFLDYWLGAVVIGLATAGGVYVKDWLFDTIEIWPVVLVIGVIVIGVLAIRLYNLNPKKFKPFSVYDTDLNTIWWVQSDPKFWTGLTFDRHYPNNYTNGLLDGPFCGIKRENGVLCLGHFSRKDDPALSKRCGNCKRALIVDEEGNARSIKVDISEMKLFVIHALQREARRGRRIKKKFSFGMIDLDKKRPAQGGPK